MHKACQVSVCAKRLFLMLLFGAHLNSRTILVHLGAAHLCTNLVRLALEAGTRDAGASSETAKESRSPASRLPTSLSVSYISAQPGLKSAPFCRARTPPNRDISGPHPLAAALLGRPGLRRAAALSTPRWVPGPSIRRPSCARSGRNRGGQPTCSPAAGRRTAATATTRFACSTTTSFRWY